MKLKGEKELKIEELYNSMEEELYDLTVANNLEISKLDITDYDNFIFSMNEKALMNSIYFNISSVIFQMDLKLEEAKALLKISENKELIVKLGSIVKDNIENVNIHNSKILELYLKGIISGITLGNGES